VIQARQTVVHSDGCSQAPQPSFHGDIVETGNTESVLATRSPAENSATQASRRSSLPTFRAGNADTTGAAHGQMETTRQRASTICSQVRAVSPPDNSEAVRIPFLSHEVVNPSNEVRAYEENQQKQEVRHEANCSSSSKDAKGSFSSSRSSDDRSNQLVVGLRRVAARKGGRDGNLGDIPAPSLLEICCNTMCIMSGMATYIGIQPGVTDNASLCLFKSNRSGSVLAIHISDIDVTKIVRKVRESDAFFFPEDFSDGPEAA
jgi:hypothetical protein